MYLVRRGPVQQQTSFVPKSFRFNLKSKSASIGQLERPQVFPASDYYALTMMPPELLRLLPRLPAGLEYRFMDRDLILWDPHANLIVDFIPNALELSDES
jgi:hypothetical protein